VPEPYESNIGRFMRDHPDHQVKGRPNGRGYEARRRGAKGAWLKALTLDQLAELIERDQPK
jgi:hypothetical protein